MCLKKSGIRVFLAACLLIIVPCMINAGYIKGSQFKIAEKYADPDQAPVVMFDPETTAALGYIMYADVDGRPGDEIIIPYRVRIPERKQEDTAGIYPQLVTVDVVVNGKKIRGVIEAAVDYVRAPKPYITVKKMFRNETPKIFLMIYDGMGDRRGPDRMHKLLYNGFDKKDRVRKKKEFETARMPWKFILFPFNRNVPTITEFDSKIKHSSGIFYIRTLEQGAAWPKIPMKRIKKFEEEVRKYQPHIFWEYSY